MDTVRILLCHLLKLPPEAYWQLKLDNASMPSVQIRAGWEHPGFIE